MLESGQELSARFVLVRRLGTGGSGEVWLAQDRERGSFAALKILRDDLTQDVAAVQALERECEHVRTLDHPNILRVDGVHRSARHTWIAMEYASGGDLSQLRGRSYREIILHAALPIAAALAHAHRAGVIHRDVKPSNVLLSSDGAPKLADFGMALIVAAKPAANAGRGSPYTMSPQQAAGEPASVADDAYGFGAMLYELLSGYPPSYGDGKLGAGKSLAALPATVPESLARLVSQLLAESPADRPADMQSIERELAAVLAAPPAASARPVSESTPSPAPTPIRIEPPSMRTAPAQGEPLRAEWQRSAPQQTTSSDLRRQGLRRGLAAASIVVGIAAVAVVFFLLPGWVGQETPAQYKQAASAVPAQPTQPAVEKEEIDFAALARAKQDADDRRGPLEERLKKLAARAAEQWGGAEFKRANEELTAGDKEYEAREYIKALEHFSAMDPLLTTLEKRAGEVLAAQLKSGAEALQAGRSADAQAAFGLAVKIEPGNKVAAQGLKRAATLDEVLNLVANAQRMEKESNPVSAVEQFRKALALDAEAPRAAEGIARIEARFADDAFAGTMARGYSALAKADYAGARSAFEAARRVRPNAPEIPQALRQIEQEQRTGVISAKLAAAKEHEGQERWADALKEYRAVVELDSTVAAAQEGVARVSPRAALNEQLDLYLTQPERLFSQPVRAAARETLARASTIPSPGPVLQKQLATLKDWVARADVPVQVALQSDNMTQVTIYRVGELGTFGERSLDLVPGSYTVVGTRPGYRDVRREINVRPGAAAQPVVIRCEDPI
ncbi:MAG TPA: protein kinase [Steroidobacteraceae bacterium]|nr:protein kinase [Steroidobacteraceae bacterium]